MAISRLSGQMFQSTLLRDGINLSFQDTAGSNSTLYIDIANTRVGINANVLTATLQVGGNVLANTDITALGNINAVNSVNTSNVISNGVMTIASTATGNILIDASGYTRVVGTDAFYVPVGTTFERPGSPEQGAVRFNTTTTSLEVWDGTTWAAATNDLSVISNQTISPDGSTATFTLDQSTTAEAVLVTINGLNQTPTTDYTVTGNSISFTTTPIVTDIIQVRFIASTSTVTGIVNANSFVTIAGANSNVQISVNGTSNVAVFANTGAYISNLNVSSTVQLPVYTVIQANALPSPSAGQIIYVSNGDAGNPCLAVYSAGAWKRVALGTAISAT